MINFVNCEAVGHRCATAGCS